MEQSIDELPMHMVDNDLEYMELVNPIGYVRYWYMSYDSTDVSHTLGVELHLMNGGSVINTIGAIESVNNLDANDVHSVEKMLFLGDIRRMMNAK